MMKNSKNYQQCTNCVMDTSDPQISFDKNGKCDFCINYETKILPNWSQGKKGERELLEIADKIKRATKGQKYNCIIGFSGGVDSSYLCYIVKKIMGLNPLALSVDTGWNLNVATDNIRKIAEGLNIDMKTITVDWEEMKDLQVAFFKSQVPYQDLPQDHAIFAGVYNYAMQHGIKYVMTGGNFSTECVKPPYEWTYINDLRLMKDIHRKFGCCSLEKFPMCGMLKNRIYYRYVHGMKVIKPLDYVEYDKQKITEFLGQQYGWNAYENKHYENIFTRFYEGYYLPEKFGYDKRKCYLSSLILTNQLTREEALEELKKLPYEEKQMKEDMEYIANKLGLKLLEFEKLIKGENKTFRDYKNSFGILHLAIKIATFFKIENRNFR